MKEITYRLSENDHAVEFRIGTTPPDTECPGWAELARHQCPHCPLEADTQTSCPAATQLIPFMSELSHIPSIQQLDVEIEQADRHIKLKAGAQEIMGSLLGLYLGSSDCPYTRFLRPMAEHHLPLADEDETMYRVLSMYRMAQYLRQQHGAGYDDNFSGLEKIYEDLSIVNQHLNKRMREALKAQDVSEDATINAIAILDALSQYVLFSIDDAIEYMDELFSPYWDEQSTS